MAEVQFQKILDQLENHEKRISLLEGSEVKNFPKKIPVDDKRKRTKGKGEDLHAPIQRLIQDDFFKEVRTDLDVVSELQRRLLTHKKPLRASVVNVMRKMVREGILERTEVIRDERTLIAYKKS